MLIGSEKTGGAQIAAQTRRYAPIAITLVNAVREKKSPALAVSTSSADPYTQACRQGTQAGKECPAGAKSP
jgi:DNA-binding MurR/RpiR family transcriptional regulator